LKSKHIAVRNQISTNYPYQSYIRMESMRKDLTCPISLELFVDAISAPCCGRTVSRQCLLDFFKTIDIQRCPLCSQDLSYFNAQTAPKNVAIMYLVEALQQQSTNIAESCNAAPNNQTWMCQLQALKHDGLAEIGELSISIENSKFQIRPVLFIIAVDRSGSMGQGERANLRIALTHMMKMAQSNTMLKLVIIAYDSVAEIISVDIGQSDAMIQNEIAIMLNKSGGTNFRDAFDKIRVVLSKFKCGIGKDPNTVSCANLVFMSDGCDNSFDQNRQVAQQNLINQLKLTISTWNGALTCHSVGFSTSCDIEFLEQVYKCGNMPGSMRYAQKDDDPDALCGKIQSLFDAITQSTSVPITVELLNSHFLNGQSIMDLQMPINEINRGELKLFIRLTNTLSNIKLTSQLDSQTIIPVTHLEPSTINLEKWLSETVDQFAHELLTLINTPKDQHVNTSFNLNCMLLNHKLNIIKNITRDDYTISRTTYLKSELQNFRNGTMVNIGRLSDIRFASKFSAPIVKAPTKKEKLAITNAIIPKQEAPEYKEQYLYYSRSDRRADRNPLQRKIVDMYTTAMTPEMETLLNTITYDQVLYADDDGNTTLHLSCYCGLPQVVQRLFELFPHLDPNQTNKQNETPMTIAIKKHGYWKTMQILIDNGASIPHGRKKSLEAFAFNSGYVQTAQIIASLGEIVKTAATTMTPEYIKFAYETAMKKQDELDYQSYLNVALHHNMQSFAIELINAHNLIPSIQQLFDHCIPPKPDDPDTARYLELTELILKYNPILTHERDPITQETALFKAAERGSLPHVQYMLSRGAIIDMPNSLGNSPLWIASFKRYPCIVAELLKRGANPNMQNHKGNTPLYGICQKGPLKLAEIMIARGAKVDILNHNKDSMLLMCCRNGQPELLDYFLNHVEPDFVNYAAEIDGFNAIFASVESDRPECIKILAEYGINLNQHTAKDNPILKFATPLHLAAYYNRVKSTELLIELGANLMSKDLNGHTPLHLAVIQGNTQIASLILGKNKQTQYEKDNMGMTPIAYCSGEMMDLFMCPYFDHLKQVATGTIDKADQPNAMAVVLNKLGILGIQSRESMLNVADKDGISILMYAVSYSNFNFLKCLADNEFKLNNHVNSYGVNVATLARWINNKRILMQLVRIDNTEPDNEQLARLQSHSDALYENSIILYLGNSPKRLTNVMSCLGKRMEYGVSRMALVQNVEPSETEHVEPVNPNTCFDVVELTKTLAVVSKQENDVESYDSLIFDGKVFVANMIASGQNQHLSVQEVFSIYLNTVLCDLTLFESEIKNPYYDCLHTGLAKLDVYNGETYIGVQNEFNRSGYMIGNIVTNSTLLVSSSMWRKVVANVPNYSTTKKGTIFIVKSLNGRFAGTFSRFKDESEIVFMPGSRFKITGLYRGGDNIVLGQENVRQHTYGIKDDELGDYMTGNRVMVIELTEF